jgi:hypothetical protein
MLRKVALAVLPLLALGAGLLALPSSSGSSAHAKGLGGRGGFSRGGSYGYGRGYGHSGYGRGYGYYGRGSGYYSRGRGYYGYGRGYSGYGRDYGGYRYYRPCRDER